MIGGGGGGGGVVTSADDDEVRVTAEPWTSPAATRLIEALVQELGQRYEGIDSEDEDAGLGALDDDTFFVVARVGDGAVGCGALVAWDRDHGEIKRMFVAAPARGRGVARAVLATLEEHAVAIGLATLFLETGRLQPEAIGLYRSLGYEQVRCGGRMRNAVWSVCMQKQLRR